MKYLHKLPERADCYLLFCTGAGQWMNQQLTSVDFTKWWNPGETLRAVSHAQVLVAALTGSCGVA